MCTFLGLLTRSYTSDWWAEELNGNGSHQRIIVARWHMRLFSVACSCAEWYINEASRSPHTSGAQTLTVPYVDQLDMDFFRAWRVPLKQRTEFLDCCEARRPDVVLNTSSTINNNVTRSALRNSFFKCKMQTNNNGTVNRSLCSVV